MKEFTYVIKDPLGIHARPAGVLVKEAGNFESNIQIEKNGKTGDMKRIFSVMALCAKKDDTICIRIEGPDEEAAMERMREIVEANL